MVTRSQRIAWYDGPTVLELPRERRRHPARGRRRTSASRCSTSSGPSRPRPRRGPATRPQVDGDYRGYAGKIESGRVGSATRSSCCRAARTPSIEAIDTPDGPLELAVAGQSVVIRLDADLDVSRGDILAATDAPPAPDPRADGHGLLAGRARRSASAPGCSCSTARR